MAQVFVAVCEHCLGTDIRVFDTWDKAQAWKDELGAERWDKVSKDPQPEDPCGDEYFYIAGSVLNEWFYLKACEVE